MANEASVVQIPVGPKESELNHVNFRYPVLDAHISKMSVFLTIDHLPEDSDPSDITHFSLAVFFPNQAYGAGGATQDRMIWNCGVVGHNNGHDDDIYKIQQGDTAGNNFQAVVNTRYQLTVQRLIDRKLHLSPGVYSVRPDWDPVKVELDRYMWAWSFIIQEADNPLGPFWHSVFWCSSETISYFSLFHDLQPANEQHAIWSDPAYIDNRGNIYHLHDWYRENRSSHELEP